MLKLSSNEWLSCNSCHKGTSSWEDGRAISAEAEACPRVPSEGSRGGQCFLTQPPVVGGWCQERSTPLTVTSDAPVWRTEPLGLQRPEGLLHLRMDASSGPWARRDQQTPLRWPCLRPSPPLQGALGNAAHLASEGMGRQRTMRGWAEPDPPSDESAPLLLLPAQPLPTPPPHGPSTETLS